MRYLPVLLKSTFSRYLERFYSIETALNLRSLTYRPPGRAITAPAEGSATMVHGQSDTIEFRPGFHTPTTAISH
jgi:hypothetical protein